MNTLIKYLSLEAIENTITCLNYNVDKIIFFARKVVIDEEKENISSFLSNYIKCSCEYYPIDDLSLEELQNKLIKLVTKDCFFDFTGDEGLFEAAAFNVSNKLDVPVHTYDVCTNNAIVIKKDKNDNDINNIKRQNPIKLNIKSYIEMVGGNVKQKGIYIDNVVNNVIDIRKQFSRTKWINFCNLMKSCKTNDDKYYTCDDINSLIKSSHIKITKNDIVNIIKELNSKNIIDLIEIDNTRFEFNSKGNDLILTKAGTLLEQYVYSNIKENYDDCAFDVSFSWDVGNQTNNIFNEVDVVCLKDYQLLFISCKDKQIERDNIYELEAVGRGFGGNYVNMKIITTEKPTENLIKRGKELGVKVEYLNI